jgi:hypothetical protein
MQFPYRSPSLLVTALTIAGVCVSNGAAQSSDLAGLKLRPFVMTQENYAMRDGAEIQTGLYTSQRGRDGTTYSTLTQPGQRGRVRRIEAPGGRLVLIQDTIRSITTTWLSKQEVVARRAALLTPPPRCLKDGETVDGEEVLLGHKAIRIASAVPGGQGARYLYWRLPGFACAEVQMLVQTPGLAPGEWVAAMGKRLKTFVEKDPGPALYGGWKAYTERTPTQVKQELARAAGQTPETCPQCFEPELRQDSSYAAAQR